METIIGGTPPRPARLLRLFAIIAFIGFLVQNCTSYEHDSDDYGGPYDYNGQNESKD